MSKNIIILERKVGSGKRIRCPKCRELNDDIYTITDKTADGSEFSLMMCYACLRGRFFFKKDYEEHRKEPNGKGAKSMEEALLSIEGE